MQTSGAQQSLSARHAPQTPSTHPCSPTQSPQDEHGPQRLSMTPSQSSSMPFPQISARGITSPMQAPQVPPTQVCVPAWQAPTPAVPAGPL